MASHFIGIDVQSARECAYAVLDAKSRMIASGWLPTDGRLESALADLLSRHPAPVFGIDSPRMALPGLRRWYWRGGGWRERSDEVGRGRHCEVVVKACGLANPQWTPLLDDAPEWMRVGFRIFDTIGSHTPAHEVFPSASYTQLRDAPEVRAELSFEAFRPGPKDMLDAVIAALTAREFSAGRGVEVGGGDGLGTIVLPRPITRPVAGVER